MKTPVNLISLGSFYITKRKYGWNGKELRSHPTPEYQKSEAFCNLACKWVIRTISSYSCSNLEVGVPSSPFAVMPLIAASSAIRSNNDMLIFVHKYSAKGTKAPGTLKQVGKIPVSTVFSFLGHLQHFCTASLLRFL